jgi:hypothetical protein
MTISQTTLEKIKAYILDTQKNSTYNSAPHEPLEMCWNPNTAYQWNMCNCYCYLNRYLAKEGEKRGNIQDLLKCCHYAWFEKVRTELSLYTPDKSFNKFKEWINDVEYFNLFVNDICSNLYNLDNLEQRFIGDKTQINNEFWAHWEYFQLATLLIQQHETEHIDLETT